MVVVLTMPTVASALTIWVSEFVPLFKRAIDYPKLDAIPALMPSSAFGERVLCGGRGLCMHTDDRFLEALSRAYPHIAPDATLFDQYSMERRVLARFLRARERCHSPTPQQCPTPPDVVVVPSPLAHCPWTPHSTSTTGANGTEQARFCTTGATWPPCVATHPNGSDFLVIPGVRWPMAERGVCTKSATHQRYWTQLKKWYFNPAGGWTPLIVVAHPIILGWDVAYTRVFLEQLAKLAPTAFRARVLVATLESNVPLALAPALGASMRASEDIKGSGALAAANHAAPLLITMPYTVPVVTPVSSPLDSREDGAEDSAHRDRRQRPVLALLSASAVILGKTSLTPSNTIRPAVISQFASHARGACNRTAGLCVVCTTPIRSGAHLPAACAAPTSRRLSNSKLLTAVGLPAKMPGGATLALALSSIFCIEPSGDTVTRSHFYVAVLSGCVPVIFDGGHADFTPTTWWAWRGAGTRLDGTSLGSTEQPHEHTTATSPYRRAASSKQGASRHARPWDAAARVLDYRSFAIVLNATTVTTGEINVIDLLVTMVEHEPERVAALQAAVRRAAPYMRIARDECSEPHDQPCDAFSLLLAHIRHHAQPP